MRMTGAEKATLLMGDWRKPCKIIYGCESRGDGDVPYLSRYTLFSTPFGNLYLHVFHRSDHDVMHDHPWAYISLILSGGYFEETPDAANPDGTRLRLKTPGMALFRRARHIHRVVLHPGIEPVTLVWVGRRCREWGFWTPEGWEQWQSYFKRMGC